MQFGTTLTGTKNTHCTRRSGRSSLRRYSQHALYTTAVWVLVLVQRSVPPLGLWAALWAPLWAALLLVQMTSALWWVHVWVSRTLSDHMLFPSTRSTQPSWKCTVPRRSLSRVCRSPGRSQSPTHTLQTGDQTVGGRTWCGNQHVFAEEILLRKR